MQLIILNKRGTRYLSKCIFSRMKKTMVVKMIRMPITILSRNRT